MADILVLKTDVLNELRNKKYYVQIELERVAVKLSDSEISHKDRVEEVIELVQQLSIIDNSIKIVESIFKAAPVAPQATSTNVVETPVANPQDQSPSK